MAPVPSDTATVDSAMGRHRDSLLAAPIAGLLGWLLPGLGHLYLGQRTRGIVCLVTITATFWTGVAIGSVQGTVDPRERTLWFLAQLCTGGNTLAAYAWREAVAPPRVSDQGQSGPVKAAPVMQNWLSAEVGVHYTGVAGLLNLLVILDAITRAEAVPRRSNGARDRPRGSP